MNKYKKPEILAQGCETLAGCSIKPKRMTTTMDDAKDRFLGPVGTERRDRYELEFQNAMNSQADQDCTLVPRRMRATGDRFEYAIIPISFSDYDEYVIQLCDFGLHGWEFCSMIRTYENSPSEGVTTHDFICKRKIQKPCRKQ